MALLSIPFVFSAGAVIIASQHNTNFSTVYSDYSGNIENVNISATAAIVYSKLSLTGSIVNADINASAAIVGSKLNLVSPGAIGTTTPAAGKFTTLEATSTLKLGTTNQGDILYDNGTSLVRLTPGNSGQFLKTQGASANPTWTTLTTGLNFVSNTVISAATTSTDIAITNTNFYRVNFSFKNLQSDDNFTIRFNNDSGATYKYMNNGRTTGGALTNGSASATGIVIGTASKASSTNAIQGEFTIFPQIGTTQIQIIGSLTYLDAAGTLFSYVDFGGYWNNSASGTSFRILSSGTQTFDGNIYTYSYALS